MPPPVSQTRVRSLADDLRSRTDEQLVELLIARPDLARPAPADLVTLAARASTGPSVARALDQLDHGALRVLEALTVAEGDAAAAALLLGTSRAAITRAADRLRAVALVWRQGTSFHVPAAVAAALGPYVAGLAPGDATDAAQPETKELEQRLAEIPDGARRLLDSLAWGPPVGELPVSSGSPAGSRLQETVEGLVAAGLLERTSSSRVLLPRSVALVLRGGRLAPGHPLGAPAPELTDRPARADEAALAAVTTALERVDELGYQLGVEPARMLRSGSLGVRDLRRIAADLDIDRGEAVFWLEVGYAAGLIGTVEPGVRSDSDDTVYAPTVSFDAWRYSPAPARWARLALAWFGTDRAPAFITDDAVAEYVPSGARPAVFGVDAVSSALRRTRLDTLTRLAQVPPGQGITLHSLVQQLEWYHPRRDPARLRHGARIALEEAEMFGVVSSGALSSFGAALWRAWNDGVTAAEVAENPKLSDHAAASAALADLDRSLPAAATQILVQADLTAVVPGRLEGRTADLLRLVADLESRGGATVFRFSDDSVRRYLDTGASAEDLLAELRAASATGVPQPLEFLVRDVARRHGRLRVGEASTVVTSDVTSLLDSIVHDPQLARLGLRRLAPSVVVTGVDRREVVAALRRAGHAPTLEGMATRTPGRFVGTRAVEERHGQLHRHRVGLGTTDPADAAAAVEAMRAGEEATRHTPAGPSIPPTDPAVTMDVLREAEAAGQQVWIGVAGPDGATNRLLFRPTGIAAGRAHGFVDGTEGERSFSVHRLIGAVPASR